MKRMCGPALVACLLLVGAGGRADAQELNFQLVPKIGVYTPLNSLTPDAEAELGLAFGVAGELLLPRLPFSLRLNVDHASNAGILTRDAAESQLGTLTLTTVVGDFVLRPLPAAARFQPYFMAGGGVKLYAWDVQAPAPADLAAVANATRRGTLHVGAGADLRIGPAALLLEISDYVSTLPDGAGGTRLQNDLFGLLGFRVSMF